MITIIVVWLICFLVVLSMQCSIVYSFESIESSKDISALEWVVMIVTSLTVVGGAIVFMLLLRERRRERERSDLRYGR